jgi:hypothetical protein
VRPDDPWQPLDAAGARCTAHGFWYPAFVAGTIAGFPVWGFYVDRLTDGGSP